MLAKIIALSLGILSGISGMTTKLNAHDLTAPKLLPDSSYSEYWEQQFLFNDSSFVTSQFLITNLPFSKHHGIMVGTLKKPQDDTIIIKNGRKKSGWAFSEADTSDTMRIFQHELITTPEHYKLKLHNTAAEVDVTFHNAVSAVELISPENKLNLPAITLYAPSATASGKWRAGPEIGGKGPEGPWLNLGNGFGYGLHVVHTEKPNKQMKSWVRFTAKATDTQNFVPIFNAFETSKGKMHYKMLLLSKTNAPISLSDVKFKNISQNKWKLQAANKGQKLSGIIEVTKQLDTFNLKDQLNAIEKLAAGSDADVARNRFLATYSFTFGSNGKNQTLNGSAIFEDITFSEARKKKPRRRR